MFWLTLDGCQYAESLPYDAVFSLAAHSDSVTVPPSCTAKDPDSVDVRGVALPKPPYRLLQMALWCGATIMRPCVALHRTRTSYVPWLPSRAGQAGPRALLAWWRGCDAFSPVLMGPSLQSAGAPQQQTFCYANCVAGTGTCCMVPRSLEASPTTTPAAVAVTDWGGCGCGAQGKANTAKDGSVLATSKPTDYEFLVSIQPFDGEEQNVCYGQLVGAAPGSSPPPPPPPSKTDDGTDGDNSDDGEDDGGSSAGAVLGAIVGILLLVGCIVGFVYYFRGRMAKGAGRSRAKALDVFDLDEETEQLTGASKYSNVGEDAKLASLDKELEGL
eukprot:scaffold1885_cov402-Prasinococcus_capsulatus_cf.AAC.7